MFDIPSSLKGVVQNQITNIPDSLGGSTWTYDTLEFAFNKRFGHGLFLNTSFDLPVARTISGRRPIIPVRQIRATATSIPTRSPSSERPAACTLHRYSPRWERCRRRRLGTPHVSARYQFKYDIGAAVNYSGQSGWPYARVITGTLPNAGNVAFFTSDLSVNRNDNIQLLGFRVDKSIKLGGTAKLTGIFDLLNAINTNAVTNSTCPTAASTT